MTTRILGEADTNVNKLIMISHNSEEKKLAEAWENLISNIFGVSKELIGRSTRPDSLVGPDDPFVNLIKNWISNCRAMITLQTPMSRFRPWILWEAGFAQGVHKPLYVLVYQPRDLTENDDRRIKGQLKTPLDAITHVLGYEKDAINGVLSALQDQLPEYRLSATTLESAVEEYLQAVLSEEKNWVCQETIFENRIRLTFNHEQCSKLRTSAIIDASVNVEGIDNSMMIFNLSPLTTNSLRWDAFLQHLSEMKLPWPDSSRRWASGLGVTLQQAEKGKLVDEAEGLPLYFDARPNQQQSYRPSVAFREEHGEKTNFIVSFTHIPKILNARPDETKSMFCFITSISAE